MLVQRAVKCARQYPISLRLQIIEGLEDKFLAIRVEISKERARRFAVRRAGACASVIGRPIRENMSDAASKSRVMS